MTDLPVLPPPPTLEDQLAAAFKRVGADVGYLQKTVGNANQLDSIDKADLVTAVIALYQQVPGSGGGLTEEMVMTMLDNSVGNPYRVLTNDYQAGIELGAGAPQ